MAKVLMRKLCCFVQGYAAAQPPVFIALWRDAPALDSDDVIPDQLADTADLAMHVLFQQRGQVVFLEDYPRSEQLGAGEEAVGPPGQTRPRR